MSAIKSKIALSELENIQTFEVRLSRISPDSSKPALVGEITNRTESGFFVFHPEGGVYLGSDDLRDVCRELNRLNGVKQELTLRESVSSKYSCQEPPISRVIREPK